MSYQGPTGSIQDPEVFRELQEISRAWPSMLQLSIRYSEPQRPREGLVCICDGISWNPLGDGIKRPVLFLNGAWQAL